jgi:hypothetical protein
MPIDRNKPTRVYRIPPHILEVYSHLPINRSAAISLAVIDANRDPLAIADGLAERIRQKRDTSQDPEKVSVTLDVNVIDMLDKVSERAGLPIETTLALAMEAYAHRFNA